MKYTLENNKVIVIPDKEIEKLMKGLELSKADAVDLWLSDNGYLDNEEQDALDETAKKVKIDKETGKKAPTKPRKAPTVHVSDEKQTIFNAILNFLQSNNEFSLENVQVLTKNKLISCEINGITLKIDVIQQRNKKN